MNISAPFIQRPVMTTLLVLGLVMFGILGYFSMPVSDLPNVDYPIIQVTGGLPGASPETMSTAVAAPLESELTNIPGVEQMTSMSTLGKTQITLQFSLDRSLDGAAQDVQSALSQAQHHLPKGMPSPPSYRKVNPAASPILFLALTSDILPLSAVDDYAENDLANRISMVNQVAEVDVHGSQKFAVRIEVDPMAMASHNLGFDQLITAIQNANSNQPTGQLNGDKQLRTLDVPGQLTDASQFNSLIIGYQNNQPIWLNSVAHAINSVENNQVGSWLDDKPAIVLSVQRQPGANTVAVAAAIKKLLPQLEAAMPQSMHLTLLFDRSVSIMKSVHDVQINLIIASFLVVLIIFLFLKNLSATLIPSVVLPVTVIGTFAFMALLNFSIDNISLMGLTLSVGFFVDDAIVMLENILRHIEHGEKPMEAALKGSKEISFTIVSMTLSLAAAFIPLLFMPGLLGRLLHEFSVTIVLSITISALVSLTLTPMMAGRILKLKESSSALSRRFDAWFARLSHTYQTTLKWCLARPRLMIQCWFGTILLTVVLFFIVPKGFVPSEDIGLFFANTQAALDTSYTAMVGLQKQVADIVRANPAIKNVTSIINDHSDGRIVIRLKDPSERANWHTVLQQLHEATQSIPGIKTYIQAMPALNIGGVSTNSRYQFTVTNPGLHNLITDGEKVYKIMQALPQLQGVDSNVRLTNPMIHLDVDRDKAESMHVSMAALQNTLSSALGGGQVSTIYTQNNQYEVILEVAPQFQQSENVLNEIYITNSDNSLVPLSGLIKVSNTIGPQAITHQNQSPSFTISFNLKPGVSLSQATTAITNAVAKLTLTSGTVTAFQGEAQQLQDSVTDFALLIFLAIMVIYILLGVLYESFVHPLTILSTLPTASFGALLLLIITNVDLNVYGFIGLLMLVGIVKKNAIIMIDFAIEAQRKGMKPAEAIYEACTIRFRPIMMTTFAAFMGALPIALAFGAGAEARRSLGLAVVGGLLTSQLLTLYLTPVIYLYMERFQQWLKQDKND